MPPDAELAPLVAEARAWLEADPDPRSVTELTDVLAAVEAGDVEAAADLADRSAPEPAAHQPVVVEHRDAVRGEPDIALEGPCTQPQCQLEGLDGVLGSVRPRTPVGEPQRRLQHRRQGHGHGRHRGAPGPDRASASNAQHRGAPSDR